MAGGGSVCSLTTIQWGTTEQLKHEKYLFLAGSGPYRDLEIKEALRLLAERVEERVSTEHAKWVSDVRQAGQQEKQAEN